MNVGDNVPERGAPLAAERIKLLNKKRNMLATILRSAQKLYKRFYNKMHKLQKFKAEQKVILAAKNIKQLKPNRKLSDKYLEPFVVKSVVENHNQAYRLKLPSYFKIYNVFYISLLKPWKARKEDMIEPGPIQIQNQLEYKVKSI